jgi:hypothetical protein
MTTRRLAQLAPRALPLTIQLFIADDNIDRVPVAPVVFTPFSHHRHRVGRTTIKSHAGLPGSDTCPTTAPSNCSEMGGERLDLLDSRIAPRVATGDTPIPVCSLSMSHEPCAEWKGVGRRRPSSGAARAPSTGRHLADATREREGGTPSSSCQGDAPPESSHNDANAEGPADSAVAPTQAPFFPLPSAAITRKDGRCPIPHFPPFPRSSHLHASSRVRSFVTLR